MGIFRLYPTWIKGLNLISKGNLELRQDRGGEIKLIKIENPAVFSSTSVRKWSPESLVGQVRDKRGRAEGREDFGHKRILPHRTGLRVPQKNMVRFFGLSDFSSAICLRLRGAFLSVRAREK